MSQFKHFIVFSVRFTQRPDWACRDVNVNDVSYLVFVFLM